MSSSDRYTRTADRAALADRAGGRSGSSPGAGGCRRFPSSRSGRASTPSTCTSRSGSRYSCSCACALTWRWTHPAPPMPPMPKWQAHLARLTHVVLYVALFVMPLAGYLGCVFSGYPVKYFGMTLPAWGWKDNGLKDLMSAVHFATSWVLAGAVDAACLRGAQARAHRSRRPGRAHGPRSGEEVRR